MKHLISYVLVAGLVFTICACSSKNSSDDDPINAIKALSEKVSQESDDWEKEQWDETANELESLLKSLPSPLETDEEISLKSSLMGISMNASMHERKAAKMIKVLKKYEESHKGDVTEDDEEAISSSYDMTGSVDKYPITMHIDIDGTQVKGTYYYNKQGSNAKLNLSGTYEDGEMDLNETTEDGVPTGHFKGEFEDGVFKGEFINTKGKSLDFLVSAIGSDLDEVIGMTDDSELYDVASEISDDDSGLFDDATEEEGDSSIDEFLDEYEKFWKEYMNFFKKANRNDPTFLVEYPKLIQQYMEYADKLDKMRGNMSMQQLNRINKMSADMLQEAQKYQ